MVWKITLKESVADDLRWFGPKDSRRLLRAALERLRRNPLAETRNMKTLRPNKVAQRELRLFGDFRVLFNADPDKKVVTIVLVGEKTGNILRVQGEDFTSHHESNSLE